MSHKVTTLVYSRIVGSAVRKGVLSYMADRASDDGRGVWCSKQTIADETEFGRSTVIRTCNDFVAEGLLIVTGDRKCANGATVEYALNLDAIRALSKIERNVKGSQSGTSPDVDPSQSGTSLVPERDPTRPAAGPQAVPERDPNHQLTIHEPSVSKNVRGRTDFDDFWEAYPHRHGKKTKRDEAEKAFAKALKGGATVAQIAAGVEGVKRDPDTARNYQRGPIPWLNQRGWTDEVPEHFPQLRAINGGHHGGRNFDDKHREYTRLIGEGKIQRGPDASDPFAGG